MKKRIRCGITVCVWNEYYREAVYS